MSGKDSGWMAVEQWDQGVLYVCVPSHADVQAVVAWLFRNLHGLCEQSEQMDTSCPQADIARAVLSGEFTVQTDSGENSFRSAFAISICRKQNRLPTPRKVVRDRGH